MAPPSDAIDTNQPGPHPGLVEGTQAPPAELSRPAFVIQTLPNGQPVILQMPEYSTPFQRARARAFLFVQVTGWLVSLGLLVLYVLTLNGEAARVGILIAIALAVLALTNVESKSKSHSTP